MKKLLLLLAIALTIPAIADADKIKTLEDRVTPFAKEENALDIILKKSSEKLFCLQSRDTYPPSINDTLSTTLTFSLLSILGLSTFTFALFRTSIKFTAGKMILPKTKHINSFLKAGSNVLIDFQNKSSVIIGAVIIGCTTVFNSKNAAVSMLSTKEDQHNAISDIALQANITNIYE